MAIRSIEESKALKRYGEKLGRQGIAQRVIEICKKVAEDGNYKDSIKALGVLRALSESCKYDEYWHEKMIIGFYSELEIAKAETV
jgi:hypothetical protein